jgi:hypothetical protein
VTPSRTQTHNPGLRSRGDGRATGGCAQPALHAVPVALTAPGTPIPASIIPPAPASPLSGSRS